MLPLASRGRTTAARAREGGCDVIRLRLFGPIELKDSLGSDVGALLTRPKRFALLAYLAVEARASYTRRDELLARFWPELDAARARNALNQAVRTIRQALGAAALQSRGDEEIRVDPDVVWCDVADFRRAIDSRSYEAALSLYRGELLPGFFAPGARGFEEWLEQERSALRRAAAESAKALAEADDSAGDLAAAVHWVRRAVELSDNDERALRHLLDLLDRLGDRAGAIEAYEAFAHELQDDMGTAPSAETVTLIDRIRRRERPFTEEGPAQGAAQTTNDSARQHADPVARAAGASAMKHTRRSIHRTRAAAAVLVFFVLASVAFTFVRPRAGRSSTTSPNRVAVFPIRVHAGTDLQFMSEGVMDLVGQALHGVGDLRRVDPNALMPRLSQNADAVGADEAKAIATAMGAGRWILGSVMPLGTTMRLSLSLYHDRSGGDPVASIAHDDSVTRLDALVKRTLSDLLMAQQVGGGARLKLNPAITPHFGALKAYLQAEALLRRGQHVDAAGHLEHAVAVDPEFAVAWYRLSFAKNFAAAGAKFREQGIRAVNEAMRHQARLSERDRKLVGIYHALVHGDGPVAQQRAKEFTRAYPDDAEGWTMLAITQIWHAWQGRDRNTAYHALQRALALDKEHRDARQFFTRQAMARRDYSVLDSIVRAGAGQGGAPLGGEAAALVAAFGRRDPAAQRNLIAALVTAWPERQFLTLAINVAKHTDDLEGAARIARLMTDSVTTPAVRKQGHYLLALLALARGQRIVANTHLMAMRAVEGDALAGFDVLFRAWFAASPALATPAVDLRSIRDTLDRWRPPTADIEDPALQWHQIQWSLGPAIRLYLLGLICVRLGDERSALLHADALEQLHVVPDSANLLTDLALEIRALASAEAGRHAEALSIIEGQKLTVRWIYDVHNPLYFRPFGRLLRAELLRHVGRHDEALAWYSSFAWSASPEFVYLAPVNLGQAQSLEALGRLAEAAMYYRRFIARWRNADADLQDEVSGARARLLALERQRHARR